jgi:hypothetical protein
LPLWLSSFWWVRVFRRRLPGVVTTIVITTTRPSFKADKDRKDPVKKLPGLFLA